MYIFRMLSIQRRCVCSYCKNIYFSYLLSLKSRVQNCSITQCSRKIKFILPRCGYVVMYISSLSQQSEAPDWLFSEIIAIFSSPRATSRHYFLCCTVLFEVVYVDCGIHYYLHGNAYNIRVSFI